MPVFLDTNILLYSISTAPDEQEKRRIAEALLERDDCALSVQTMQEFYVQATRPSREDALPHQTACGLIEAWMRCAVQENTVNHLRAALEVKAERNYSFWDCAIIAAARAGGCETLYTEDMAHGHIIDGMTIVNPFRKIA